MFYPAQRLVPMLRSDKVRKKAHNLTHQFSEENNDRSSSRIYDDTRLYFVLVVVLFIVDAIIECYDERVTLCYHERYRTQP
jgi:hypothetical protein